MRKILSTAAVLLAANVAAADSLNVSSCSETGISFNSILSMKTFGNGSIKVFDVDTIEPAAAAAGIVVAVDRGEDLSTMESFCRHITGLSSLDLKNVKSSFDAKTNTLTLKLSGSQTDADGESKSKKITVQVKKGAEKEADLVRADVN